MSNVNLSIKKEKFVYDMVTADFYGFRNGMKDTDAYSIAQRIEEETGREEGRIMINYASRLVYCVGMAFDWHEDAPPEVKAIEDWWNLVESGASPGETYLFWMSNIPNYVANGFQASFTRSHRMWKPPEEETPRDEDEAEELLELDPNL